MWKKIGLAREFFISIVISFVLVLAAWVIASKFFGAKWLGSEILLVFGSLFFALVSVSKLNNFDYRWRASFAILAFFMAVICFASKWPGVRNSFAPALLSAGFIMVVGIRHKGLFWISFPWVIGLLLFILLPIAIAIFRPDGLTAETVFLIRQSSLSEAIGWLAFSGSWVYLFSFVAGIIIAVIWLRRLPVKIYAWHGLFGLLLFVCGLALIYPGSHLQTFYALSAEYDKNIDHWRVEVATRIGRILPDDINKSQQCCSKHIVIVGESLSRRYMGAYGYGLPTTPNLQKLLDNEAIAFTDVISPHLTTHLSLQYVLTMAQTLGGPQPYQSPTLIEALQSAGYKVSWLSNQSRMGEYDATTTVIADKADFKIFLSDSLGGLLKSKPDEVLLPQLELRLKETGNQVIFLHIMGQHALYADRYPDGFTEMGVGNKLSGREAEYVNAVLYGDAVYGKIIDIASKANVTSVVSFSDHGELVGQGHDSNLFRGAHGPEWGMVEVPLVVWVGREGERDLKRRLIAGKNNPFMLDNLPHLLFDIYGVKGRLVDPTLSLISTTYHIQPRYTLGGSVLYAGPKSKR